MFNKCSFPPSPCLLDKGIRVENFNRLWHDVGMVEKEWGCFKLYVKPVFFNYLWIEIIITVSNNAMNKWLKFGQKTVNKLLAR